LASEALVHRIITTHGVDETRAIAVELGRLLHAGDTISMTGDLGAGKTTFTQGLALGLDIPENVVVNSPTFTILAEHHEGRVPLFHFDVYRLNGPADLYELAFDEYVDGSGVVVVEWADRITEALPSDTLFIALGFAESSPTDRQIQLVSSGPRSSQLIEALVANEERMR
jgi:tRNA threonylcarbamoyladenosine biosynthesis protein TsaE